MIAAGLFVDTGPRYRVLVRRCRAIGEPAVAQLRKACRDRFAQTGRGDADCWCWIALGRGIGGWLRQRALCFIAQMAEIFSEKGVQEDQRRSRRPLLRCRPQRPAMRPTILDMPGADLSWLLAVAFTLVFATAGTGTSSNYQLKPC
jgi:hypothetical protein